MADNSCFDHIRPIQPCCIFWKLYFQNKKGYWYMDRLMEWIIKDSITSQQFSACPKASHRKSRAAHPDNSLIIENVRRIPVVDLFSKFIWNESLLQVIIFIHSNAFNVLMFCSSLPASRKLIHVYLYFFLIHLLSLSAPHIFLQNW